MKCVMSDVLLLALCAQASAWEPCYRPYRPIYPAVTYPVYQPRYPYMPPVTYPAYPAYPNYPAYGYNYSYWWAW